MSDIQEHQKNKQKLSTPADWSVVVFNDAVTPMEFVTDIFNSVFHHPLDKAEELMMQVHTDGKAIAGNYTYELAEAKCYDVTDLARSAGYPLQLRIDKAN
jgi:ATP-dependent Clp protease adaptor protein ClpS